MARRFNPKPRRVWTGLTVPGKKMMKLLLGYQPDYRVERGNHLIALYENAAEALITCAAAVEAMPRSGLDFGPSMRGALSPTEHWALYGGILTDLRDFLKLRFRTTGTITSSQQHEDAESAVRFAIHELDVLSRSKGPAVDWETMGRVRDALLDAGLKLAEGDEVDAYAPMIEPLRERRGQPPRRPG